MTSSNFATKKRGAEGIHEMNRIICIVLCGTIVCLSPSFSEEQGEKPNKALLGAWTVVESRFVTSGGREVSLKEDINKTVRIDEKWFVFPGVMREQYVLDNGKKPQQINFFDPKRGNNERDCLLGIYKISEKELTLIWSKNEGRARPNSFEWPPKARGMFFLSLRRAVEGK